MVPEPLEGLSPSYALDVFHQGQDAAAHARLVIAPGPAPLAVHVNGETALAPVTPFRPMPKALGRFTQKGQGNGLQQGWPVYWAVQDLSAARASIQASTSDKAQRFERAPSFRGLGKLLSLSCMNR